MAKADILTKREQKKARRDQEQEAVRVAEQAESRRRIILMAIPALTVVISLVLYFLAHLRSAAGMILLCGFLVWMAVGLGVIGRSVPARDRGRGGSIDYGRRR